jgi:hypothetical protein
MKFLNLGSNWNAIFPATKETSSVEFLKGLKDKLKPFSDFLGSKKFFVSDDVTFVDFHAYELLVILKVKTFQPS